MDGGYLPHGTNTQAVGSRIQDGLPSTGEIATSDIDRFCAFKGSLEK